MYRVRVEVSGDQVTLKVWRHLSKPPTCYVGTPDDVEWARRISGTCSAGPVSVRVVAEESVPVLPAADYWYESAAV